MTTGLDAQVDNEIFRKNWPEIIAKNRQLASILGIRMPYVAGGYPAGQVMARNSVSGFYEKYDNGASSGLDTAVCILLQPAEPASGATELGTAVVSAEVYQAKLVDLDANAITDLHARSYTDAFGNQILKF